MTSISDAISSGDKESVLSILVAEQLASDPRNSYGPAFAPEKKFGFAFGGFDDPAWLAYRELFGVTWDTLGTWTGVPTVEARGGRDYVFRQNPDNPFSFTRSNGERTQPRSMITDGGTIPRPFWCIPGLDPWTYMPGFLCHDYRFYEKHCLPDEVRSFESANDMLAEAIYTLMMEGVVPEDWRTVAVIHAGCASFVGRDLWDKEWTQESCDVVFGV